MPIHACRLDILWRKREKLGHSGKIQPRNVNKTLCKYCLFHLTSITRVAFNVPHRIDRLSDFLYILTERHLLNAHRQIWLAHSFNQTAEQCWLKNTFKRLKRTSFFFCPPPGGRHSTRSKKTDSTGRLEKDLAQTDAMTEGCSDCETRLRQGIGFWVDQSTTSDLKREGLWVL